MSRLLIIGAVLMVAAALIGALVYRDVIAFAERPLALPAEGAVMEIARGQTIRSIARHLYDEGYLDRPVSYLELLARWDGSATRIKAGEYRLEPELTPEALLALLVSGRVIQYRFTIVEGWTFRDLLAAIRANPVLEQTLDGLDGTQIMERLGRPDQHAEGRFLPDTYRFPRGTSDLAFLRRAMNSMDQALAAEWQQRQANLPLKTPDEALVLASIVEKETAVAQERGRIAGVFIRRLRRSMRLQTDPTVIYGLGADFDGNLRRRDLRQDNPYNTYTRSGLPPTPIALPGRAALHASLHPADGDELYFVAKGDGSHYFSSSLREHNAAVRKYQLKR